MSKTDPTNPVTPTPANAPGTQGTNVVTLPAKATEQRASDKVISFVKRHPVITVAGGIAIGVAVSALLPRRTSRQFLNKAASLAEKASAAGVVLGKQAGEKAHDVSVGARKQASVVADRAEKAGDVAAVKLEKYGLAAMAAASAFGRATAKRAHQFGDAAADTAHHLGDVAADRSSQFAHMADDLRKRTKSRLRSRG